MHMKYHLFYQKIRELLSLKFTLEIDTNDWKNGILNLKPMHYSTLYKNVLFHPSFYILIITCQ